MLAKHNTIKKNVKINTEANITILLDDSEYDRTTEYYKNINFNHLDKMEQINKKNKIDIYRKNMLEIANINKTMKIFVHELVDEILENNTKKNIYIPRIEDGDYLINIKKQPSLASILKNTKK